MSVPQGRTKYFEYSCSFTLNFFLGTEEKWNLEAAAGVVQKANI